MNASNSLQTNFLKAYQGVADWTLNVGTEAVKALARMEEWFKVTPNTFKTIEQFRVPEDYLALCTEMLNPKVKPNMEFFRKVVNKILNRRYWSWHLLHPNIGSDRLHPTRRMLWSLTVTNAL